MRVAITGGIGEGKSTVLTILGDLGHTTQSADSIAREIAAKPEVRAEIAALARLRNDFAPADLRDRLASSEALRRAINRLMHPLVMSAISRSDATFVEVPLLIEACLQSTFDQVWVVTCGAEEQRRRLLDRYSDPEHVERMLATQLPTRAKIPFAELVVRTNAPLEHVRRLLSAASKELTGR